MKFVCANCNYRFESDEKQTDKRCSYCGERKIIKEPQADDLIKDVQ